MRACRLLFQKCVSSTVKNSNLFAVLRSMPKEKPHIVAAQKQRRKIKEKLSRYIPGTVTLQVLGTGSKGAPTCLYVFSDQSRYLFNCGEGTQRLAHEHKRRLAKLEHIFVTHGSWKNIGGLPGAALTIQDVGVPQVILHGPPGLQEVFTATSRFVVLKDLEISTVVCNETTHFEDNVMKIQYVPLHRQSESKQINATIDDSQIVEDSIDYYAHEHSGRRKAPGKLSTESCDKNQTKGIAMAYICRLQPRPGALCLEKCVEFGVPPGPLLGRLKSQQDVTLPNGKLVKSSDVCEPNDPGPVFIVLECPTLEFLDSLVTNDIFTKHQITATCDEDLAQTIIHFTPSDVMNHSQYRQWMDKFSPSTHHLVLNDTNTCMGSSAVHRIQYKLNLLSDSMFPLLADKGTEIIDQKCVEPPQPKKTKNEILPLDVKSLPVKSNDGCVYVNTLLSYHLRPKKGVDRSYELKLTPSEFLEETLSVDEFQHELHETLQKVAQKRRQLNIRDYPRLLFLGTGSSIPNKTRNTSGMLLEITEDKSIVLDVGEGTCGQIVRFFGENANSVLSKIKAVYVSHLHADHHLGLIGLIQGRRKALQELNLEEEPLLLFAPQQIMWWLNFYDNYFEDIKSQFHLIPNGNLLQDHRELDESLETKITEALDLADIKTCSVCHCPRSFGVSLTLKSGPKITYSGDTMPSENLVELGKNSDLLIHEATMEDELAAEALIKLHSTTSQAIDIGRQMNAKFTLLTHFSQRYAKLPRFNENFSENVGIAFDNMQIKLDELPLIPLLYPALKVMFAADYEELEHKAARRQLRIELENEAIENKKAS